MKRESELTHDVNGENVKLSDVVSAYSTGNDLDVFKDRKPKLKMTGIFYDRFFKGLSYDDLSVKYDITVEMARSHFAKAVQKIDRILDAPGLPGNEAHGVCPAKDPWCGDHPQGSEIFFVESIVWVDPFRDCPNGRIEVCRVRAKTDYPGVRQIRNRGNHDFPEKCNKEVCN